MSFIIKPNLTRFRESLMTECEIGNFAPQNNVENGTSLELARVKTGIHVKYLIFTNLLMQFTCLQQIFHTYNWKS